MIHLVGKIDGIVDNDKTFDEEVPDAAFIGLEDTEIKV